MTIKTFLFMNQPVTGGAWLKGDCNLLTLLFHAHESSVFQIVVQIVEGHVRDLSLSSLKIKPLMDPLYCLKIVDRLVFHYIEDKRPPGRFRTGSSGVVVSSYLWPLL